MTAVINQPSVGTAGGGDAMRESKQMHLCPYVTVKQYIII
jgi:hypothetical protein